MKLRIAALTTVLLGLVGGISPISSSTVLAASDILTVTSTADAPACPGITSGSEPSLRCAITDANTDSNTSGGSPVPVTINFDIPSSDGNCSPTTGVCVISPASSLPALTRQNVTIDGYGQPGPNGPATANTNSFGQGDNAVILIQLDGSSSPVGSDGLQLTGGEDVVEGLSVTHWDSDSNGRGGIGISMSGATGSTVEGNFVGLTPSGSGAADAVGVAVNGPATVGGSTSTTMNVINGDQGYTAPSGSPDAAEGIDVTGTGAVVEGNLIGTNPAGTAAADPPSPSSAQPGTSPALTRQTAHHAVPSGADPFRLSTPRTRIPSLSQNVPVSGPSGPPTQARSSNAQPSVPGRRVIHVLEPASSVDAVSKVVLPPHFGSSTRARTAVESAGLPRFSRLEKRLKLKIARSVRRAKGKAPKILPADLPTLPVWKGRESGTHIRRMSALSLLAGAKGSGIEVHDASGVAIGPENIISGNNDNGVSICDTSNSFVMGNLIGTDLTGSSAVANGGSGIQLSDNCFSNVPGVSENNTLGGPSASERNIVSGNGTAAGSGFFIPAISLQSYSNALVGTAIEGNYVGTDAYGTKAIPNGGGVFLAQDGADISGITIGGTAPGEGNVISGNTNGGIYMANNVNSIVLVNNNPLLVRDSSIEGNLIGVDATGNASLGNGRDGIYALETKNIRIGVPGSGNVIGGNGNEGISSQIGTGMVMQANDIGVGLDRHTDTGNSRDGIAISGVNFNNADHPGSDNTIGGTGPGDGNIIAYNGGNGVVIGSGSSDHTQAAIEQNSIYGNMTQNFVLQLGQNVLSGDESEIQLSGWFPSSPVCSTSPSTTAPNDFTPCPIITGETSSGGDVASISGTACTGCRVEVFTATNGFYDSQQGGSQIYLGAVAADQPCASCAQGFSAWSISSSDFGGGFVVPVDQPVTATATQQVPGSSPAQYETSELAQDYAQTSRSDFIVTRTSDSPEGLPCDDPVDGQFIAAITLRCALAETDFAAAPTVTFDIPTGGRPSADPGCSDMTIGGNSVPVCKIEPLFPLPNISTDGVTVDGTSQPGSQPNTNPVGQPDNAVLTIWIDGSAYLKLGQATSTGAGLNGGYFNLLETTSSGDTFKGMALTNSVWDAISGYINTTVQGDLIGVAPTGSSVPSTYFGAAAMDFFSSTYGGGEPSDRNVIDGAGAATSDPSDASGDGIFSTLGGDTIQGNYIGTDPGGTTADPNLGAGIEIGGAVPGGLIGGSSASDRNIIAGTQTGATWGSTTNDAAGILIDSGSPTSDLPIEGNYIGTDAAGTAAIPNGDAGIHLESGSGDITMGGRDVGEGNLISGNGGPGIQIDGGGAGNEIQGNTIGLDANGNALGNGGDGILVDSGTTGDEVGGQAAGASNTIEDNGGNGVTVGSSATDANTVAIDPNLIHDNTGPAIVLTGQTSCASGLDTSGRPNDYTPCPTGITLSGPSRNATVSGDTCPGCLVEVFIAGDQGGTQFLGSAIAGTCASPPCAGNAQAFSITDLDIGAGQSVTLTATQENTGTTPPSPYETSQYSPPVAFSPSRGQDLSVTKTASASFTRTYSWSISKSVDNSRINTASGGNAAFHYGVEATQTGFTDSGWELTGTITVANPNSFEVDGIGVTDAIDDNGSCSVSGGSSISVSPGGSATLSYTCSYPSAPSPSSGTNTATATWNAGEYDTPDGSASGTAAYAFESPTTNVNKTVTVSDSYAGALGAVTATDAAPYADQTFAYTRTIAAPIATCQSYANTASLVETGQQASQSVQVCGGSDLSVSPTAATSFARTYAWGIAKSSNVSSINQAGGGTAPVGYTVTATQTGFADSGWTVSGNVTISNPNNWESITANVTDAIDHSGSCSATGATNVPIPAGGSATVPYSCTFASNPGSGTDSAMASWNAAAASTADASKASAASYAFGNPTTRTKQNVTVTDSVQGTLGTVTAVDSTPYASETFTYTRTLSVPASGCTAYPNTATIVQTGQSASASVQACGSSLIGGLYMDFWEDADGLQIISNQAKTGVCPATAWLRTYAPFQDLSAWATCRQVAAYTWAVLNEAFVSQAIGYENGILKGQMLTTALNVYFSNPSLGGDKIAAYNGGITTSVGSAVINLTKIGGSLNTSPAFGGAASMTVNQMLAYAGSQSDSGGLIWYRNVKATETLAAAAFSSINDVDHDGD